MASPSVRGPAFIPIRGLIALVITAAGLVLLLSFKTPDPPPASAGGAGRLGAAVEPRASGSVSAIPARTGAPPTTPSPANGGGGVSTVTPAPAASGGRNASAAGAIPAPTAAPVTPAPTAPPAGNATVMGPAVDTPYGPVQVEAKISGGRIVDIVAVELPYDRRRSQQISQYVEPILHDEALQAQSARIDGISGATWTSGAYMESLQGALDQLHG